MGTALKNLANSDPAQAIDNADSLAVFSVNPMLGPTFTVNSTADTDNGGCDAAIDCTLHEAVRYASDGDTVNFAASLAGQTIRVQIPNGPIQIGKSITIDGSGLSSPVTISGDSDNNGTPDVQVFYIYNPTPPTVTIRGLTIASGLGGTSFFSPYHVGGGIEINNGTVNIANSTFYNNSAYDGWGGAIAVENDATANIVNSTFRYNSALISSAVVKFIGGSATVRNSILANSSQGNSCHPGYQITDGGNNIDDGTSCGFGSSSMSSTNPQLGTLTNGVYPLNSNSPAIDAGDPTTCADAATVNSLDQRGYARNDLRCDAGAYEYTMADGNTSTLQPSSASVTTYGPALAGIQRDAGATDPGITTVTRSTTWKTTPDNAIGAYWYITPTTTSGFSLTLELCYTPAELGSLTEANLRLWRYSSGTWSQAAGVPALTNVNSYHCATVSGINTLSAWTLAIASPTAVTLHTLSATSQPIDLLDSSALPIIALLVLGLSGWWFTCRTLKFH